NVTNSRRLMGSPSNRGPQPYHIQQTWALCLQQSLPPIGSYGSLADIPAALPNVRFTPESRHHRNPSACPLSAKSRHSWPSGIVHAYWPPKLGSPCTRVTGGGFHLPVSASDFGA